MNTKYPFLVEFTGTPEAGKTTCIKTILNRFSENGISVQYIQESAEIVSYSNIPKKSFEAHLSMRLKTIDKIINAKYENYDLVLIDRGLLDGIFYTMKFLVDNPNNYNECQKLIELLDCLKTKIAPNLLVIFKAQPETAIKRKGHEGSLVNLSFCKDFNTLLVSFQQSLSSPNVLINTDELSKKQVADIVYDLIINEYEKTRRI